MAKYKLEFLDNVDDTVIRVYKVELINALQICIESKAKNVYSIIELDKSTAIKFAKTLRTEINKITESEVNNG